MSTTSSVTTDLSDYAPGAIATVTATGFAAGSEVRFEVDHVSGPGADGIYGTADDVIVELGGDGHDPWYVIDGGQFDLDGEANGTIVTQWWVNPDDSAGERFLLTASTSSGWFASNTFTDAKPVTSQGEPAVPNDPGGAYIEPFLIPSTTGTGSIRSIVKFGETGFEQAYNSDYRPNEFDETNAANFNRSIQLALISKDEIEFEGEVQEYYQFNLDLNESNSNTGEITAESLITLHTVKIFASTNPSLTGFNSTTNTFANGSATLIFDMDAGGDVNTLLTDWNAGSGTGDYSFNVPVLGVNGLPGFVGLSASTYIYIYSEFGQRTINGQLIGSPSNAGFEEWFVVLSETPSLAIDKVVSSITGSDGNSIVDKAGDIITYTLTVSNTGNVNLTGVVVTDPYATTGPTYVSGDVDSDQVMGIGEVWTYTATHVVTQDELDTNGGGDGDIDNTAFADSVQTEQASDSAFVTIVQNKALMIVKEADRTTVDAVTQTITYSYTVTNEGNAAIANVVVEDDNATASEVDDFSPAYVGGDEDGDELLDVGETWSYEATRSVTQEMLDAGGSITNVATVTGDDATPDDDDATVEVDQNKALMIVKEADRTTVDAVTQTITYTYTVTNEGNAAIANVVVEDDNATASEVDDFSPAYVGGDEDGDELLDVGETWSYEATRSVTQEMLDAGGSITNVATVTGDDATPDDDDATVEVDQNKALMIVKEADRTTVDAVTQTITYTYTVTNEGNAAIANVVVEDDNATASEVDDFSPAYVGGDEDGDELLDVGETWSYEATRSVTQEMLDAGGSITNVATVTGDDATPDDDDATVEVDQNPEIVIDKVTIYGDEEGDGLTGIHAGDVIGWKYTVTNTGNAALSGVSVSDNNGTENDPDDAFEADYESGDDDDDGLLDVDETWIFTATGIARSGEYVNVGTVTGTSADGQEVSDTDDSSYLAIPREGLIAPTGTTPQQYISGTAQTFQDYYDYQGGVIQYGVKGTKINQTNPGVFFYFTGASGAIVGADGIDSGSAADSMTVTIDQTRTGVSTDPFLPLNNSNVQLYKVSDVNDNDMVDAEDTLASVKLSNGQISVNGDGDVSITFTPDAVGSMYIVSVKYMTSPVVGDTVGSSPASWPTVNYNFDTVINGSIAETYDGGVTLAPKPATPMMLAGEGGDGAKAINANQMKHVVKAAIEFWAAQGEDVTALEQASIEIADLGMDGDDWLLGLTQDGNITIDDDGAGLGWSIGLGGVAHGRVDLMSVLVHEMGHVLGMSDEEMGDSLAAGERMLPNDTSTDMASLPLPAQLLGAVGIDQASQHVNFG